MDKIFVQIASYRDPQLIPTIEDMLAKADRPKIFNFGICWQYDETEDITKYDNRGNFRVRKFHYSESKGLGWARNITNRLYRGEPLVLQIDSHHRFVKGWDTMMLEDFYQAKTVSKNPVLTTYLTPFEVPQDPETYEKSPCLMSQYEFSQDKLLMSRPYHIMDYKERSHVIRARTISGHFFLADGGFLKDVPYDPDIYFGGYTEETTLSVRAFTNGYDFFSPYRQYIWHEYTRNGRPKHWEDHGTESKTKLTSGERDIFARKKTRQLFDQEDNGIVFGRYGLGNVRTLHDYEVYGGFDFKKCRIQDYTLSVKEPPNPPDWENQFISNDYSLNCEWDKDFFLKYNFEKPKLLTLGIQNSSDAEIHRKDFLVENDPDYLNFVTTSYLAKFKSIDKPAKIVMYLMDENNNWSDRYEKKI
jgi:glycosyltransferase involved in cell wall biosynthesis